MLVLIGLTMATGAAMWVSAHSSFLRACLDRATPPDSAQPASSTPTLFQDWPTDRKPDLAVVVTGQEYGYLLPCGCSKPQLGGLARRANFLRSLKEKEWPVAAVDLGDLIEEQGRRGPQALLKYQTSMKALAQMGYLSVGLGRHEMEMPLLTALGEYALNNKAPQILAANLKEKGNFADTVGSWSIDGGRNGAPRLGVVGVVGPTVQAKVPRQSPEVEWAATTDALTASLQALRAEKPELIVLLYQGTPEEARSCVHWLHKSMPAPHIDAVVCLSAEEEPSDRPQRIDDTLLISVGHKGRYVGVLGAFRSEQPGRPFELHYQLVALGEEYETPNGREDKNPVLGLMEEYARQVKADDYLGRYPIRKHPTQVQYPEATYVGSDACRTCHTRAFEVWDRHPHSHAYQALVDAKHPSLRQFDGECVVCHVVGFGHEGGYRDETKTAGLRDVGCESCHGPGSLHAEQGKRTPPALLALMNPYKVPATETPEQEKHRLGLIDQSCQKCHDTDNDVHWSFAKKWPLVVHHADRK